MNLKFWKKNEKYEPSAEELYQRSRVKRCPKCDKAFVRCHNSCPKDAYEQRKKVQAELFYYNCPYCEYRNLHEHVTLLHMKAWHKMLLVNHMFEVNQK